jgi:hypothetical protein
LNLNFPYHFHNIPSVAVEIGTKLLIPPSHILTVKLRLHYKEDFSGHNIGSRNIGQ